MRVVRALVTFAATAALALGAQGVVVASETQVVPAARITALADPVARAILTGADASVAPAFTVADQVVPAGAASLAIAGTPFVSATYVSVPVVIRIGGKVARTVVAGYRITRYISTAVAARDLVPGTVIATGDIAAARVAANGRPAVGTATLVGRRVRAATAKGAPLYLEQTAPDELVKAGQPAILIVHDGSVALAADVIARTGGALGELVTVFNPQTGKALSGTVTAANRVELNLPSTNAVASEATR